MSSCCRCATGARKDAPCTKPLAPPARLRPRPASSCAVRSAACSRPRRSASRVARRAEYDATTSAAKSTAQTIAAVLRKTRPAMPRAGEKLLPASRPAASVSVIPNERVRPAKFVEMGRLDVCAGVDYQLQCVEPRLRNDDLFRRLAYAVLMPGVDDVTTRRDVTQDEVPRAVRLCGPHRRHGDDKAHHHRVDVAVYRIDAGTSERGGARRPAPI